MTKQKAKSGPARTKRVVAAASADAPKTKLGQLEAMLRRKEGATIAQLATALDWQPQCARRDLRLTEEEAGPHHHQPTE